MMSNKKTLRTFGTAAASLAMVFALGCGSVANAAVYSPDPEPTVLGGWTVAEPAIPEEAMAAFDAAMAGYVGMGFNPIALLGTQVVAGTNYAFLCTGTTVTAQPVTSLKVVVVYQDLQGKSRITGVSDVTIDGFSVGGASAADAPAGPVVGTPSLGASPMGGGWTVNAEYPEANVPEQALAIFNKAFDGFVGVGYQPIALLGTQVVAGTNYAFLCKATTVTAQPVTSLKVVIVYQDLQGKAEIRNIADFSIGAYTTPSEGQNPAIEQLAGGWTISRGLEAVALPEDVQAAFDKAFEGFVGVGYQPIAYLGSQVVAGTNYAILCKATMVTAQPVSYLAVVTIYKDLGGNAVIMNIAPVSIADFNI